MNDDEVILSFPSEAQAMDHFRTHGEDRGKPYVIKAWEPAPATGPWPPRRALGWNSTGKWVWLDSRGNPEGRWP